MIKPEWIAVDWGTSQLRIWALSEEGEVLAELKGDQGMGGLESAQFETVLIKQVEPWISRADKPLPVIACGMVGARQGWREAPYADLPWSGAAELTAVETVDPRIEVHICSGVQQRDPADVMRGEETQVAGWLASRADYRGALCLPGTHSKWCSVASGQIERFTTFMTGEMFALLTQHSVLRFSTATDQWSDSGFSEGLVRGAEADRSLLSELFSLRAQSLVSGRSPAESRAYLSGLLIGSEIAGAADYWFGQTVALIGESALTDLYASAMEQLAIDVVKTNATELTLAGLKSAYEQAYEKRGIE